jgi:biopolymer transport protein ExbD
MLKRPSSRKRNKNEPLQINLVALLDTIITLVVFLMFSISIIAIVSIDSPVPITSAEIVREKLERSPLQLTLTFKEGGIEIWSPFDRIPSETVDNLPDGSPDVYKLHDLLVDVKQSFPEERAVVLVPNAGTNYDHIIAVIDAARELEDGDPPLYETDPETGIDVQLNLLFPEVVFGNLLGGS